MSRPGNGRGRAGGPAVGGLAGLLDLVDVPFGPGPDEHTVIAGGHFAGTVFGRFLPATRQHRWARL